MLATYLQLDRLVFIPAAQQPLKRHQESAPPKDRLRMLELMAEGDARFEVDAIEVERVAYLSRWTRSQSMRDGSLILSASSCWSDAFALLDQWRDAERVVSLAHFVVMTRAANDPTTAGVTLDEVTSRIRAIGGEGAAPPRVMDLRRIDVSSTEIRERST